MTKPLYIKYKNMVISITEWLKDELKHDAEIVNGLGIIDEFNNANDEVHGRYEVCRELLHYIRSIGGEEHDELDT